MTANHWDDLLGTNLRAPLFLSQAAAPAVARVFRSLIVNMLDIHAQRPLPRHPVYSTAKAGLTMLTRSLARELGPEVRVIAISPDRCVARGGHGRAAAERDRLKDALKRPARPTTWRAQCVLRADAPYVTGQILAVDGAGAWDGELRLRVRAVVHRMRAPIELAATARRIVRSSCRMHAPPGRYRPSASSM